MKLTQFWQLTRSTRQHRGLIVRLGLTFCVMMISFVLASLFLSEPHTGARATTGSQNTPASVLQNQAAITTGSPTPSQLSPGPTAPIWYFAEGRVGAGFREYLTIENPNTLACPVITQYFYTKEGTTTPLSLSITATIPANSRMTRAVHADVQIMDTSPTAAAVSAIVSATGGCPGIVVERPIYFAGYHGILSSGTDALGVTKLGQSFTFADFPYDGIHTLSFLTILNPGNATTSVTANFYSNGSQVATETISVLPQSRGTIFPNMTSAPLPAHTAVIVTADHNVAVERPSYFMNANGTAGAADVLGAPTAGNDWLFSEGFTSSGFQEFLTIANVSNTDANTTVTLKSQGGSTRSVAYTVPAFSQTIVDVNTLNVFLNATPEVSAEVTSTLPNIVVQRQLYFNYHHSYTTAGDTQTTIASGVTDIMGQLGPVTTTAYSFSEGYTNTNYNEWITIQNPTNNAETIWITMVNELSQNNTVGLYVPAHSRGTLDMTATVRQYLAPMSGPNAIQSNQVSLTVQTINNGGAFLVERSMYWNTANTSFVTQGGSDIIGYTGG